MSGPIAGMRNAADEIVDLYIPRKCSATNRMIGPKDHASVQLNVAVVDEEGVYTGESVPFAFCGSLRRSGNCDAAFMRVAAEKGLL
ncbi:ribosomal protein S21e [Kipferlia bialata]|uniref:40S ribosomal protein S21 n=1 Tax=Kipferlia bialata TaxID=797122 RepID=A0A9K3D5J4_9EUKA|nr:ribosomal protein S21e [Kipferlia bialata]|eukprot:g11977.t1